MQMSLFETQRIPITLNTQYVNILFIFFYSKQSLDFIINIIIKLNV